MNITFSWAFLMRSFHTIGYEGATLDDFIAALIGANVATLVDVREAAISRKKGFSKRGLAAALASAGLAYAHLPRLGDPKGGPDRAGERLISARPPRGGTAPW